MSVKLSKEGVLWAEREARLYSGRIPLGIPLFLEGEVISSVFFVSYSCNRGHGTYMGEEKLIASVAGSVERVNKLICVKALKTR